MFVWRVVKIPPSSMKSLEGPAERVGPITGHIEQNRTGTAMCGNDRDDRPGRPGEVILDGHVEEVRLPQEVKHQAPLMLLRSLSSTAHSAQISVWVQNSTVVILTSEVLIWVCDHVCSTNSLAHLLYVPFCT